MATQKKYSINWEDDEAVSYEVDGVKYDSLEDVPDEDDRNKLEAMADKAWDADFEAEFKKAQEEIGKPSGIDVQKLILTIFSVVAGIMLIITTVSAYGAIKRISKEASAPGRVVDVVKKREYVNEADRVVQEYFYPVIEFVSEDGRRHNVQLSSGSSSPEYEIGDEITVLYDPQHPLDARIKSFGSSAAMWILPSITGILGVAFLVAVIVVKRFMSD